MNFQQRVAVKAFIINSKNELLIVKRSDKDSFQPNIWELPGGKVGLGEDPNYALIREVKEETNLNVKMIQPLNIQHFKIEKEKFWITMIIYYCKSKSSKVTISKEHSEYKWVSIKNAKKLIVPFFHNEIDIFKSLNLKK